MKPPLSRSELNAEIEAVEAALAAGNALLLARPFEAYQRLAKVFGTAGQPFAPFGTELFQEISDWYSQRYGHKMNPDIYLGEKPVLIRGVSYLFKFPVGYGTVRIHAIDQIQGITTNLLNALTQAEHDFIEASFKTGYRQVTAIETMNLCASRVKPDVYDIVSEGRKDLGYGVAIFKAGSELQAVLFHSHQAAEKFMKGAWAQIGNHEVETAKKCFGKSGHNLKEGLKAIIALDNRFSAMDSDVNVLHDYVPDMTIRYQEKQTKLSDAVTAIEAAFRLCSFVAEKLFSEAALTNQPKL